MEATVWSLRTLDSLLLAAPIAFCLAMCFGVFNWDFMLLAVRYLGRLVRGRPEAFRLLGPGERPPGLVVIPSLLRNRDDLNAITTTIESCGNNSYPGALTIVASVDGPNDAPALFAELRRWVQGQRYPENVEVHVASTPTRLGKMMAVEAGVDLVRRMVATGQRAALPELYFSIDGDGTLSPNALEHLAARLTTPHRITGRLRRVVSGKICIRHDLIGRGWRAFFSVKGQIYIQVAREFMVSNIARFNWKPTPQIGIPGALYCTWFEVIDTAPRYMGFMQTIRSRDWLRWWFGGRPPAFSASHAPSLPEALTGASDDTCIAFLASIASWKNGKLDFDAPRTPLHALGRMLLGLLIERSHDYAPEARVYTFTPSTLKGLWTQRVRWNASRVECAGRFWRAFWFHWEIGLPVSSQVVLLLHTVFDVGIYYVLLPIYCFGSSRALVAFLIGYAGQTIAYTMYTVIALGLERERRQYWRVLLCMPLASLYCILINCLGCVVGVSKDIFLLGNSTSFAPEWTLMNGKCERIAILFRVRRFLALCVRSALQGDVPLGWFWVGWQETPWTPSGYEGWTTRKGQRPIVPRAALVALGQRIAAPLRPVFVPRAAVVVGAVFVLAIATPSRAGHHRPPLQAIPSSFFCVTSGSVEATGANRMLVESAGLRGVAAVRVSRIAELSFRYLGETKEMVPLANGEERRQIGLKLRAGDDCNVVYVMWQIEPKPGVRVSVKYNPDEQTHEECGAGGYINLPPTSAVAPPPIRRGELHTLRASLAGTTLAVTADGVLVWQGPLPPEAFNFDGPAGVRSDNARFDFELRVPGGAGGAIASRCPDQLAPSH